jgi:Spy/CpxP family protein refolding chaperone
MRQRLSIALVAIVAFAVGLCAGLWVEQHRPLPPPPAGFGSEFSEHRPPYAFNHGPRDRADLRRQIEALRPQLEAFRAQMTAIDDDFSQQFDAVLNPEQRTLHKEFLQRRANTRTHMVEGRSMDDDHLLFALTEQSGRTILWDIVVPLRLEMLSKAFKLGEAQRDKTRALLLTRRTKVLALIDSSPPPSVMLSKLAPLVERAAHPHSPPPPAETR